jgi:microcystin-dependent protein
MFSNTEFNHLKLKLDQLYLSLSGGKVNGETVFSKKVTFGSGKKTIKIHDGIIEGLDFPEGHLLGTCTTAAATAAKVVTLTDVTDFELTKGTVIVVKFTNSNTAQNPTLNVNGTGAKSIYYNTSVVTTSSLWVAAQANRYMEYMYDGTNWVWISQCFDNNTTYSAMSKSELTTGTATTSRVVRADYLKSAILDVAESSDVDTADNITTFTSSDTTDANANAWTSVTKLSSGEDHKSIFAKMSQMFKNVRYLYNSVPPIGTINAFGGTTAPNGWLLCQGQAISRTNYSKLFSVIGTNFGSGNGSTTFNVPDLRGEFLRGAGTNSHSGCGNGGSVGQHQNPTKIPITQFWSNGAGVVVAVANGDANKYTLSVSDQDTTPTATSYYCDLASGNFSGRSGNNGTYTVRPTNTSVNYIIRAI